MINVRFFFLGQEVAAWDMTVPPRKGEEVYIYGVAASSMFCVKDVTWMKPFACDVFLEYNGSNSH